MLASAILPEASVRLTPKDGAARLTPEKPGGWRHPFPENRGLVSGALNSRHRPPSYWRIRPARYSEVPI
jgi:hypothetical protein